MPWKTRRLPWGGRFPRDPAVDAAARASRRGAMRPGLLVSLALAIGVWSCLNRGSAPPRPPLTDHPYFPDRPGYEAIGLGSAALGTMGEPSLWKHSRADRHAAAFRLLCVPSSSGSFAVRIVRTGTGADVRAVKVAGSSDSSTDRIQSEKILHLTPAQWDDLDALADRCGFWDTAPRDERVISDGTAVIVEGVREGRYHAVHRQSPDSGPYRRLCIHLLGLSGLDRRVSWGSREPLSLPLGRFALVKTRTLALAIRFVNHTRIGRGGSDYGGATYEWFLQTDGSGDLRRDNVVEGYGETRGSPAYRPEDMEIPCGPLAVRWSPCYSDLDYVGVVRAKCKVGRADVIGAAVSDWTRREDININDKSLWWSRGE